MTSSLFWLPNLCHRHVRSQVQRHGRKAFLGEPWFWGLTLWGLNMWMTCCVMLVRNGIYSEYSIPMYMRYIAYMRYYILYVVHVYIMCTMVDLHTALLDYMWTFTLSSQYVSQAQDSLGSSPASTKITFGHLRLLWPDIKRGDFP